MTKCSRQMFDLGGLVYPSDDDDDDDDDDGDGGGVGGDSKTTPSYQPRKSYFR